VDEPVHTPLELVESLHRAFGNNHVRAIHAKGIFLEGEFTPDARAKEISKAPHLQGPASKVVVRFSDFSGLPTIPDNDPLADPRGMAVRFQLPGGATTDLIAHSYNGFPVSNTDDLRDLILALAASTPRAETPNALDWFLEARPAAKAFVNGQKTPASFGAINYYGIGTFKFTNAKGRGHQVRYELLPEKGEELLTKEEAALQSANYLMDEIRTRVANGPVYFGLYAQVAEPADNIKDPSIVWPDTRKRVYLGRLAIARVTPNTPEEHKGLVFNPSNLPPGIEASDLMSSFYAKTFRLAANEAIPAAVLGK
jgi:catalase